jgi:integrase
MHPDRLSRYFRLLTRSLGLKVRLHDLRHAAVTIQLAAGVPLAIVSEVAGHASVSFTDSRYGHLQPEHLRDAAEAMGRAYGGQRIALAHSFGDEPPR